MNLIDLFFTTFHDSFITRKCLKTINILQNVILTSDVLNTDKKKFLQQVEIYINVKRF